ncbi:hypothetical protein ACN28S_10870 [Cystobacter fuscus]
MKEAEDQSQGQKLLSAVERIISDTDSLIALAEEYLGQARKKKLASEAETREAASAAVVGYFSTRAAISGGLAAAPALIPGVGSLAAVLGGTLADMGFLLKYEVEMALVLSHLHGFDIRKEEERQLAILLASVGTYDAKSGRNAFLDMAQVEGIAIWKYAPREVSKMLLSVMTRIALLQLSKSLVRALPLVGIAVGSSMNKVLTSRVGDRCIQDLRTRRELTGQPSAENEDDVVDATVREAAAEKPTRRASGGRKS